MPPPAGAPSAGHAFPADALRELLEASADWIWETDADLRFSWLSESYQAATGIDPASVLGRFRFDFLKQVVKGSRHAAAHLEDLQARRPFRDFVYELKGGSADCRWVSTTGFPRFDAVGNFAGYRGIGRNVTALAGAFDELEGAADIPAASARAGETASNLGLMVDSMPIGVVVVDAELRTEVINRAFYDFWQIDPARHPVGGSFRALMEASRDIDPNGSDEE